MTSHPTDELRDGLARLAHRRLDDEPGVRIENLRRLSGGANQQTWSFDLLSPRMRQALVMRRAAQATLAARAEGDEGGLPGGLRSEARLIALAAEEGVPVPTIRHVLEQDDGLGEGFIMERLDGETLGRRIARDPRFEQARRTLAFDCGRTLARIHRIQLPDDLAMRCAPARTELEHYRQLHRRHGTDKPVFELAMRWLEDHLPATDIALAPVHGDFRNGNLMVDDDGLRAVLDWELAHLGDPMEDLGWLCVNSWRFGVHDRPVGGFGTREQLFAGYESQGGRVDPGRVFFWEVLGTLKWGVMCEKMAHAYLSGAEPSVERAAIGRRSSETEIDLLALLLPRRPRRPPQASPPGKGDAHHTADPGR